MPAVPLQRVPPDLGLRTARYLLERRPPEDQLPIAPGPLHRLLPRGLHRGELYELCGDRSSGRFSTVLALLAAVTACGETAALIDLGDHFDPQEAIAAGVDLARLLWLRPSDTRLALHAAETTITGGFPLVVCDLGMPPIPGGRGAQSSWLRLLGAVRAHRAALVISAPYRTSGTAATVVIELRRGRVDWRGASPPHRLLAAVGSRLTVKKIRGAMPDATADLLLRRGDLAIAAGIPGRDSEPAPTHAERSPAGGPADAVQATPHAARRATG